MRLLFLSLLFLAVPAVAAPKLAPLPAEVAEIAPNFYRYTLSWTRLTGWVNRYYGKESTVSPVEYRNGVGVITVEAKNPRFKWSHIHFFRVGDKLRISVVPRAL